MALRSSMKYYVVDAFAESPFHGNPAAVCFLNEDREEKWLQSVAREFNLSATCYLKKIESRNEESHDKTEIVMPKFRLRWFAPATELNICGHGTIAAACVLFATGMVKGNKIEFHIKSGQVLFAERITTEKSHGISDLQNSSIRLVFPLIPLLACDSSEMTLASTFTNYADRQVNTMKMSYEEELIAEYSSGELIVDIRPSIDEIKKWPGRGVVVTGAAPKDSGFDFYSRFFCPNLGMDEDPVCGSIHCALAPYWSKKLGKTSLKAYMASPRGGVLDLHVHEGRRQVFIQGKAILVMNGSIFT